MLTLSHSGAQVFKNPTIHHVLAGRKLMRWLLSWLRSASYLWVYSGQGASFLGKVMSLEHLNLQQQKKRTVRDMSIML